MQECVFPITRIPGLLAAQLGGRVAWPPSPMRLPTCMDPAPGRGLGRDPGDDSVRRAVSRPNRVSVRTCPAAQRQPDTCPLHKRGKLIHKANVGSNRAGEVGRPRRNRHERCLPRSRRHDHDSQRTLLPALPARPQEPLPVRYHRPLSLTHIRSWSPGTAGGGAGYGSLHRCAIVEVHNRLDTRCCLRQHRSDALSYLRAVSRRLPSTAVCQRHVASQPSRARQLP